jgi:two-component system, chemotaxis family, protein-glutamate methylesterase/glutaminase
MPLRVLTVDDSPFFLEVLAGIVRAAPGLQLAGSARNGREAIAQAGVLRPDIVTLDVEMPEMDGLAALPGILAACTARVIMVSSHTRRASAATVRALALGAADFVTKPGIIAGAGALGQLGAELAEKITALGEARSGAGRGSQRGCAALSRGPRPRLIVMGSSTGGIAALTRIVKVLPSSPRSSIVAVQHLPGSYTQDLARTLSLECRCPVVIARDGQLVEPGTVYVARGGLHLTVYGTTFRVARGEPVNGFMPSIDVALESAARGFGPSTCAVILTGIGRDGAAGLGAVRDAGGLTLAQDEASSVVFGMPRAAIETGKVDCVLDLEGIAAAVADLAG